jgi:hypothetical protein
MVTTKPVETQEITASNQIIARPSNDLPFSSERLGRVRAYHGREEPRAQPAASRYEPAYERARLAFGCCNGLLSSDQGETWYGSQKGRNIDLLGVQERILFVRNRTEPRAARGRLGAA